MPSRRVCRVFVSDTVIVRAGKEKLLFANVDNSSCSHLAGTAGVLEHKEVAVGQSGGDSRQGNGPTEGG